MAESTTSSAGSRGSKSLLVRTGKRAMEDDALGLAAQLGFYFFLAVFPAFLFLIALASFFPLQQFTQHLTGALEGLAPPEMMELIRQQLEQLSERRDAGLLSLGLAGAIWSASAALVSVIGALNRAYNVEETRSFWKARLIAIALTIGLGLFVILAFTLVVAGPQIAEGIAAQAGLGGAFTTAWNILQWPVAFGLVVLGISLVYYFAPNTRFRSWKEVVAGAIVATVLWLVASLAFRYYVTNFGDYQAMYGAIGGVIVLMFWFYLSGLALLIGAELNAELVQPLEERRASRDRPDTREAAPEGAGRVAAREATAGTTGRWSTSGTPRAATAGTGPMRAASQEATRPSLVDRVAGAVVWLIWPRVRS